MNKSIMQTAAVFSKNMTVQFRWNKLFVVFSVPFLCGFLLVFSLIEWLEWLLTFQAFYMPLAICGVIRSYLMMIVNEKQDRQKENQLIMGLNQSSYYLGWILSLFFQTFLSASFYSIFVYIYVFAQHKSVVVIDSTLFYVKYLFYSFAVVGQMLVFSSFFTNGRKATDVYAAIYALIILGFFFIPGENVNIIRIVLICIFPQNLIVNSIVQFDHRQPKMSLPFTLLVFSIQGFLGIFLYLYLDQIMPNEYGTHKKPFFFLSCFKRNQIKIELIEDDQELGTQQVSLGQELLHQKEELDQNEDNATVRIQQLTKIYDGVSVVDNLSLNIYENSIFCLLGHNGAGKSTTINMICGLIQKNEGNIIVNKFDVDKQLSDLRQNLGFCSQKDVIYGDLSVYDHLKYYGKIKLINNPEQLEEQINHLLQMCQLQQDKNQLGMYLSGGGKRKLSLAIALMGNSKVLLLDEPTTGLDPISRQQVWNILREVKKNRCIILTTHFLDEAQELADKVGIIQSGKMTVYGTVDYIKRQFSVGYNISLECLNEEHQIEILNQIQPQINALCQQYLNYISQNKLIRFNVPLGCGTQMGSILEYLETYKQVSLNFEMTTLEDAYIKIHTYNEQYSQQFEKDKFYMELFDELKPQYNCFNQIYGLVLRRLWIARQNKWQYLLFIFIWTLLIITLVGFQNVEERTILFLYVFMKMTFICQQAYYPIYEKQYKIKQSFITHGMKPINYWISNLLFDTIVIFFEQALLIITLLIVSYNDREHVTNSNLFVIFKFISANVLYSICLNCQTYAATHFYTVAHTSNVELPLVLLFYQSFILIFFVLCFFRVNSIIPLFFLEVIAPCFSIFFSYDGMNRNNDEYEITQYAVTLSSILFFGFIIIADYTSYPTPISCNEDNINVSEISQVFDKRQIIENVSFQVKKKQIFGLLGPNGAGKTTTFNILTRLAQPKTGKVEIYNEKTDVGYVPSFSPLHEDLNIKQHLIIFGCIKGMNQNKINNFLKTYCKIMDIDKIINKKVKFLSGGERRKVQLGIALIGGSLKLMMDEPTSGLDPVFRKEFQQIILKNCQQNESSAVITTHSMSEAQKICDILGIMVNGQLKFNGSLNQLRQYYDNRVQISLCLKQIENKEILQKIIEQTYQNQITQIQEVRINYISYLISNENIKLSQLFRFCQSKQVNQLIEDFQIQLATLDQIFKHYVQQQQIIVRPELNQNQEERKCGFLAIICCQV